MYKNIRVIRVAILAAVISGTAAQGILDAKDLPLPKPRMEPIPGSSARTRICSAPPKAWRPSSGARSTGKPWPEFSN